MAKKRAAITFETGITLPEHIQSMLSYGGALVVNVSGGKDSDCMALELAALRQAHGWQGRFVLIHADVGRMEWRESLPHCEQMAARLGAEFVVVRHSQRDLLAGIQRRAKMLAGTNKPPFPSSAARYCTSDFKRGPIDVWLRNNTPFAVCAMGLRAEESEERRKKETLKVRKACSRGGRLTFDWLPIHKFSEQHVWQTLGYSLAELDWIRGEVRAFRRQSPRPTRAQVMDFITRELAFTAHPAYALGNQRVSCACCILGSLNDLRNGAEFEPEAYHALRAIEDSSGKTFQPERGLANILID